MPEFTGPCQLMHKATLDINLNFLPSLQYANMISTYLQCERLEAATVTKFSTAKRSSSRL